VNGETTPLQDNSQSATLVLLAECETTRLVEFTGRPLREIRAGQGHRSAEQVIAKDRFDAAAVEPVSALNTKSAWTIRFSLISSMKIEPTLPETSAPVGSSP